MKLRIGRVLSAYLPSPTWDANRTLATPTKPGDCPICPVCPVRDILRQVVTALLIRSKWESMASSSDAFVALAGGPTLPREVIHLAIDLEIRGVTFTADGDRLAVRPRDRLTPTDITAIARWKPHLLALLAYDVPTERVQ